MMKFSKITLSGADNAKFLQGQLTVNVDKLSKKLTPCAISNLKGRVQFGLWAYKSDDDFVLIIASDLADEFIAHLKKYGAFSKINIADVSDVYACVVDGLPSFHEDASLADFKAWAALSIQTGNAWITKATTELFQPQELRLHQRHGVDYDKGCYLGQEIIARLYFKASPKAYLHRMHTPIKVADGDKLDKIQVVNAIATPDGYECLVIGSPEQVAKTGQILPLPSGLNGDVARVS
ncbi:folate-binding Fe/S cluster repair protein [Moraxella nasovis]|uniref:CAF17-like 4Fe-4S cluster assembly/insertion protein YgfZ n=1 Tax=Moraxella nasovis TaxID=2904121 RepID=UPI001F607610|nr:folate-binding Fe/S cluster repair protein [Moraxella nasovis]UNU72773.1 folate-binding Fe/S cluster repair protein [Moraxella nasovis]